MKLRLISALLLMVVLTYSCKQKERPVIKERLPPPVTNTFQERTKNFNLDKSQMDMLYYPPDYPVLKMAGKTRELPVARVIYSRPIKEGRSIFGSIVKYGEYWRLGANESTEIEFFRDVTVAGKRVKKGRYIIYCIPYADKWTIRLNNDLYTWGLKVHDSGDLYSFDIPVIITDVPMELFTMEFMEKKDGAELAMGWDSVRAFLPFSY